MYTDVYTGDYIDRLEISIKRLHRPTFEIHTSHSWISSLHWSPIRGKSRLSDKLWLMEIISIHRAYTARFPVQNIDKPKSDYIGWIKHNIYTLPPMHNALVSLFRKNNAAKSAKLETILLQWYTRREERCRRSEESIIISSGKENEKFFSKWSRASERGLSLSLFIIIPQFWKLGNVCLPFNNK